MKLFFLLCTILLGHLEAVIPEKVVICMACRDASAYLPKRIPYLENLGALFEDYRIVVYENNSEDATPSQLYRWKRANSRVSLIVEFLSNTEYERTIINKIEGQFSKAEQRALGRNKALNMALSLRERDFSYIICLDANVEPPSLEQIEATFKSPKGWDAVFARKIDSKGKFSDWEAFRDGLHPLGPELLGDRWHEEVKRYALQLEDTWYPVYSAFGGFAIYKKEAILNCKYRAIVTSDLECMVQKWILKGLREDNEDVKSYLRAIEKRTNLILIKTPQPNLPYLTDKNIGIVLKKMDSPVIWRMHSSAYQYPSVCEHVAFHASMHKLGHTKLFINPRLVCVERDSRCASHPSSDGF